MCVYVYMLRVPRVYTRYAMVLRVVYGAPELDRGRVTRVYYTWPRASATRSVARSPVRVVEMGCTALLSRSMMLLRAPCSMSCWVRERIQVVATVAIVPASLSVPMRLHPCETTIAMAVTVDVYQGISFS